jgi:23S rRNA (cytidine1920-2'-O)/16S rRNA (cytidine1409-2'-O)-methyltransferase
MKTRADELVVELGLAEDLPRARAMIMAGVLVATWPSGQERKLEKPGDLLPQGSTLRRTGEARVFVARSGKKLEGALDRFGVDVKDRVCADIGIAAGGFTDCLLRRGARKVYGVDVAYGQVAWSIRSDPRVVLHERTNARLLPPDVFGERVDLLVADVSFISLATLLPALVPQLKDEAELVLLVKPQFELPKAEIDEGGVITDPNKRRRAIEQVVSAARTLGLELKNEAESTLPGRDGNVEHLVHLVRKETR